MTNAPINIPKPEVANIGIRIKNNGMSMIHNRFSEASGIKIETVSTGKAKTKNAPINIKEVFEASQYRTRDGKLGVPAVAVKASMVAAAKIAGENMTDMKKAFHVTGDILPFAKHSKPIIIKDFLPTPGSASGGRKLTIRAEIEKWEVEVPITFNKNYITEEQLANLLSLAGFHCGLMDNRPNSKKCSGSYGLFELVTGN